MQVEGKVSQDFARSFVEPFAFVYPDQGPDGEHDAWLLGLLVKRRDHDRVVKTDGAYLKSQRCFIEFQNLIAHGRTLATIAHRTRSYINAQDRSSVSEYPPMRALFAALLNAEQFVHFVSYGISPLMIGSLKMAALRVPVRGIVSNLSSNLVEEFTTYRCEALHK